MEGDFLHRWTAQSVVVAVVEGRQTEDQLAGRRQAQVKAVKEQLTGHRPHAVRQHQQQTAEEVHRRQQKVTLLVLLMLLLLLLLMMLMMVNGFGREVLAIAIH